MGWYRVICTRTIEQITEVTVEAESEERAKIAATRAADELHPDAWEERELFGADHWLTVPQPSIVTRLP